MLKTYSEFINEVNNIERSNAIYAEMRDKMTAQRHKDICNDIIKLQEGQISELCKKYPSFGSMYKLNKTRRRA